MLPVWTELQTLLDALTQEDIDSFANKLPAPSEGEEYLASVESDLVRRCFTLGWQLHGKADLIGHEIIHGKGKPHNPELQGQYSRLHTLSDIVTTTGWVLAKDGAPEAWGGAREIGFREGWRLYRLKGEPPMEEKIREAFQRAMERAEAKLRDLGYVEPDEEPEKKPQ